LKLPLSILFFAIFATSVIKHDDIANSSLLQREVRGMLTGTTFEGIHFTSGHKDFEDIDTKEDVYLYIKEVILPLFINPLSTPDEDRHRVLRYNQLIGGLQLQQVRRKKVLCSTQYPDLGPFPKEGRTNPILANFGCYPWDQASDICFGPWNTSARDGLPSGWCPDSKKDLELGYGLGRRLSDKISSMGWGARRLEYVPQGGGTGGSSKGASEVPGPSELFSSYMYEHEGLDRAIEKLDALQTHEWIDFSTAWLGVRFLVFNPDLAMFCHVTVHVYFPPSGALLPHITAQSFTPEPYLYMSIIALDATWLMLLFGLIFTVLVKVYHTVKTGSYLDFATTVWNWLDISVGLGGLYIAILWLVLLDKLVSVKKRAMEARNFEPAVGLSSDLYPEKVAILHNELTSISDYLTFIRLMFCWYTLLISMKFLESFSAQPRLAVVTSTIARSGTDLFHFLIVWFIIFMSYTVAGMFLFGRRMWEFSSLQYAMTTCFRIMLGDFDWEQLGEEHPLTAGFWFWTYIIVMMMLILNMLMAIIMDTYTEVKADASEHDPIWTQIMKMCGEFVGKWTGSHVGTDKLLRIVEEMPEDEVDVDSLMHHVGAALSKEQAEELLNVTQERVDSELNKGVTISEAMRMIGWVKIAVQKIGWKLEDIMQEEKDERALIAGRGEAVVADDNAAQDDLLWSEGPAAYPALPAAPPEQPGAYDSALDTGPYVAEAEGRLEGMEQRLVKMEEFMQEALQYTTFRGKDLRNRLAVIEDLIRSQRDATMVNMDRAAWDQMPPMLGQ